MAPAPPTFHHVRYRCPVCTWTSHFYGSADAIGADHGHHFYWCPRSYLMRTPTDQLSAEERRQRSFDLTCIALRPAGTRLPYRNTLTRRPH